MGRIALIALLFVCLNVRAQFTNVTVGTANAGGGDTPYAAFNKINYALNWLNTNLTTVSNLVSSTAGFQTKTSAYTTTTNDNTIFADASGGAFTITLLAPASAITTSTNGFEFRVVKTDTSTNIVTVNVSGGATISGSTSRTLTIPLQSETYKTDGTNYFFVSDGGIPRAYVTDYGASPTASGSVNAAAFAKALALNTEVYVPGSASGSTYTITSTISLATRHKLIGVGYAAISVNAHSIGGITVASGAQNWHVENLILSRASGATNVSGIKLLGDNKRWSLSRVTLSGFNRYGFESGVGDVSYGSFENCFFLNNSNATNNDGYGSGFLARGVYSTNLFSAISYVGCWFNGNDGHLKLDGSTVGIGGIELLGNSFEGSGRNGNGSDSPLIFREGSNITGAGNYIEANATAADGASVYFDSISQWSWSGGLIGADISGVLYATNGIIAIGRTNRTGNAGVVSGVYFNNVGQTGGNYIAVTNAFVEAVGCRFDFGGVEASDSDIAAHVNQAGTVLVRGRGTPGANKLAVIDSTGKLETWTATPTVTSLTVGTPTITSGSGVPGTSPPNGSLFLRTDGTGPNLYVRENGAWVAK